jgi:hypothetical protein
MKTPDDRIPISVVLTACAVLPVLGAALAHETLAMYLSGRQYTYLCGAGVCLAAWLALAIRDLERVRFVTASVAVPWTVAAFFLLPPLFGTPRALSYVFDRSPGPFDYVAGVAEYAAVVMGAGLLAVGLQRGITRVVDWQQRDRGPGVVPVVVTALVAVGLVVGGGLTTVVASGASVSDVETAAVGTGSTHTPGLVVTVDGERAPLHLSVTDPNGSTTVRRVDREELRDGSATVGDRHGWFDPPLRTGEYEIALSTPTGVTVDTTTYTIERGATASFERSDVAPAGEAVKLGASSRRSCCEPDGADRTRVVAVVANDGDATGQFGAVLRTPDGERLNAEFLTLEPGERGGIVMGLKNETVRTVHTESDGEVVVEVVDDGTVVTTETVSLPKP